MLTVLLIGIATFFNFVAIKWKIEHKRWGDAAIDIAVATTAAYIFGGTMTGMSIAMVASALMSLYLLRYPPRWQD